MSDIYYRWNAVCRESGTYGVDLNEIHVGWIVRDGEEEPELKKVEKVVANPENLTVEFGTEKANVITKLGYKAMVGGSENNESVTVAWDSSDYKADEAGKYTFTGTVAAKEGFELAEGVSKLTVEVTVEEDEIPAPADKEVTVVTANPETLTVEFGTEKANVITKLGYKAMVGGSENNESVTVAWDSSDYKADEAGKYTFTGTVAAKEGFKLAEGLSELTVEVTVEEDETAKKAPTDAKTSLEVSELTVENVRIKMKFAGNKYFSLTEAKKMLDESKVEGLYLDVIEIKDGKISIDRSLMDETLWDSIKSTGDRTIPYRVTLAIEKGGKTTDIGKIAIYRDGSVDIEAK